MSVSESIAGLEEWNRLIGFAWLTYSTLHKCNIMGIREKPCPQTQLECYQQEKGEITLFFIFYILGPC